MSSAHSVSILPVTSVSREVENGTVAAVAIDMSELVRPIAGRLIEFLQSVER